jgi:hypothetical protein
LVPEESTNAQGQKVRTYRSEFGPLGGGAGGGASGGQVVDPGFMSTPDLGNLRTPDGGRMPIGTTRADAMLAGATPESGAEEAQTLGMRNALTILDQMEGLSNKMGGAEGPSDRPLNALMVGGKKVFQTDTNLEQYTSMRAGILSLIVRALGEKGTLSDGDIQRASMLIPSEYDTIPVRKAKFKALRGLMSKLGGKNVAPEEVNSAYHSAFASAGLSKPPKDYPDAVWSSQGKGWYVQKDNQWFKVEGE